MNVHQSQTHNNNHHHHQLGDGDGDGADVGGGSGQESSEYLHDDGETSNDGSDLLRCTNVRDVFFYMQSAGEESASVGWW